MTENVKHFVSAQKFTSANNIYLDVTLDFEENYRCRHKWT